MPENRVPREELLDAAAETVAGSRDMSYGPPVKSFESIARLWCAYLETNFGSSPALGAGDVALMMTLVKISRLATGGMEHRDSWLDIAGYAACGYEVTLKPTIDS